MVVIFMVLLLLTPKLFAFKNWGLSTKYFPVKLKINPYYQLVKGEPSSKIPELGNIYLITYSYKKFTFGSGVVHINKYYTGWNVFDINTGFTQKLIKNYLNVELKFGMGLSTLESKWIREPTVQYDDELDRNSGKTDTETAIYFNTYLDLCIVYLKPLSISIYGGYYISSIPNFDTWTDSNESDDSDDDVEYKIKKEWLQYHLESLEGFMFGFGIKF